jgi:hypothetical protein
MIRNPEKVQTLNFSVLNQSVLGLATATIMSSFTGGFAASLTSFTYIYKANDAKQVFVICWVK